MISGMSCIAWRSEADGQRESAVVVDARAEVCCCGSCSSGLGVAEASSGLMCAAFLSFGRVGRPSISMMPE